MRGRRPSTALRRKRKSAQPKKPEATTEAEANPVGYEPDTHTVGRPTKLTPEVQAATQLAREAADHLLRSGPGGRSETTPAPRPEDQKIPQLGAA